MSASSPIPESVRRDIERMAGPLAERMLPPKVTQSATTRNVVAAVNSDGTVDVMVGGAVMQCVPATTACVGVAVGDEVIVERYGPRLYCVGIVADTLQDEPDNSPVIETGKLTMVPVAGSSTSSHVTFSKDFESAPTVMVTPVSTVPDRLNATAANVTANGFDLYFYRENAVNTSVAWLAVLV